MAVSRRDLLGLIALAPIGIGTARGQTAPACYDPATLSAAQKSLRKSLAFKEVSADPAKRCGLCVFFAPTNQECGTCALFSSGPVAAISVCSSFGRKG